MEISRGRLTGAGILPRLADLGKAFSHCKGILPEFQKRVGKVIHLLSKRQQSRGIYRGERGGQG